jgi:hypothetical protein
MPVLDSQTSMGFCQGETPRTAAMSEPPRPRLRAACHAVRDSASYADGWLRGRSFQKQLSLGFDKTCQQTVAFNLTNNLKLTIQTNHPPCTAGRKDGVNKHT